MVLQTMAVLTLLVPDLFQPVGRARLHLRVSSKDSWNENRPYFCGSISGIASGATLFDIADCRRFLPAVSPSPGAKTSGGIWHKASFYRSSPSFSPSIEFKRRIYSEKSKETSVGDIIQVEVIGRIGGELSIEMIDQDVEWSILSEQMRSNLAERYSCF